MSFGGTEFERTWNPSSWFDENQTDYDSDVFTTPQGHRPVSFVASAGDVGSIVEYPSTSPNVLAVGGTVITAFESLTTTTKATAGAMSVAPFVSVGAVGLPTDVVRHGDGLEPRRRRVQRG